MSKPAHQDRLTFWMGAEAEDIDAFEYYYVPEIVDEMRRVNLKPEFEELVSQPAEQERRPDAASSIRAWSDRALAFPASQKTLLAFSGVMPEYMVRALRSHDKQEIVNTAGSTAYNQEIDPNAGKVTAEDLKAIRENLLEAELRGPDPITVIQRARRSRESLLSNPPKVIFRDEMESDGAPKTGN